MDEKLERRRGPSTYVLSFVGTIAVASICAFGVAAAYNLVQNDIASLKRAEMYQERVNERLSREIDRVGKSAISDYSCEMVKK